MMKTADVAKTSSRLQLLNNSQNSISAPRTEGFFSTLVSYITSAPKKTNSSSKKLEVHATRKKKVIETWNDVDLTNLNAILINCLYNENLTNQNLLVEIERIVGRPREVCFYSVFAVVLALTFLHEPVGSITVFLTLVVPGMITAMSLLTEDIVEREAQQFFALRYWLVYATVVTLESFLSSLIQWDLRIFRLVTLGLCQSSRVPVLSLLFDKTMHYIMYMRTVFDDNNHEIDHRLQNS